MRNIGYYNGQVGIIEEMTIPMNERSSYFGDGVYDAMMCMNRIPLAMEDHLARFYRSAKKIGIEIPMAQDELAGLVLSLCGRVDAPEQFVYVQATRGVGMRGHSYKMVEGKPSLWIQVRPDRMDDLSKTYKCITHEDTRFYFCDIKTINLLPNVLYNHEAEEAGCDETILHRGVRVTECAHSNVHIIKNGALVTAPLDNLILPGVTRKHIIAHCNRLGIPVIEQPFTVDEMMAADEVFFSSCSALCCRIGEIDGKPVGGRAPEIIAAIQKAMREEALLESGLAES